MDLSMLEIIGILLLILGFVLVGVEMALPGFGLAGAGGIICLISGIVMTAKTISTGIVMAIIIIVILGIMLAVILTIMGSKKVKPPIVLNEDVKGKQGFLNSSDLEYLIGKEGLSITDLRPSGKGDFDGVTFDVLSEGMYILKGKKIKIIMVKGNKLVVKEQVDKVWR